MKKFSIITLGCPKNQVDSEYLAGNLLKNNFELVPPEKSEGIIIMTCSFINPAVKETENTIRKFIELKRNKKIKFLAVGGCYIHRFKEKIKEKFPEIDLLFGFDDIENFEKILKKNKETNYSSTRFIYSDKIPRLISTRNFAYLKISEGCDELCSFCIIPKIRGKFRSKPVEKIIEEAKLLTDSGFYEIILISQSTGLYGVDIYKKKMLKELLKNLLKIKKLRLLRIFYLHPADFDEEIIKLIVDNDKMAPYIDIPIQHISENVLTTMRRRGKKEKILSALELIDKYKNKRNLTVRTEIIVGFPTEREEDFEELYEFCKKDNLIKRWALFKYHNEKESFAYENYKPLANKIIEERYKKMLEVIREKNLISAKELIGKELIFIPEYKEDGRVFGHTEYDAPEIDIKSFVESDDYENFVFRKLKVKSISKKGFKLVNIYP
ncbi:MAG: 30S ribosomal protein S12 methylthiotransferase RimO [candidate division WOR-3 bacterium]